MFQIYNDSAAERIIQKHAAEIRDISACCGLPGPFLQAVLYQEITRIDLIDLLVDGAVRLKRYAGKEEGALPLIGNRPE